MTSTAHDAASPETPDIVWPPPGTAMANLLDLMVLKAITDCTVTPLGLKRFASPETPDFAVTLTTTKAVASVSFADLVCDAFTPDEVFVRHLSQHTTFHDAAVPLGGHGFQFRVIINWSSQTARIATVRDPHLE